ncbi:MAG: hypothetical protein ACI3ZR_06515 [bacterium]
MEKYIIRYATKEDIPAIKQFIDINWKKNHILVRAEGLFEWQYISNKIDYVLGLDHKNNIQGMLGYISYDDKDGRDIATSMWKANPGTGFLGIKLLIYVMQNEKYRTLFSPGINIKTSGGIYKRMNISTGKMNQWYRLRKLPAYKIAKIKETDIPKIASLKHAKCVKYNSFKDFTNDFNHEKYVLKVSVPYKSLNYIKRRYFEHPFYTYLIYGAKIEEETQAVIILREQKYNDSKVIRFVDCIGNINTLTYVTNFLDEILQKTKSEYIDLYEKGVPESVLRNAGWTKVNETKNIIPNYFSPYEQCNVEINYCTTDENIVLFRGDGDQDRPN